MIVLNRADQADPESNKRWAEYFKSLGYTVLETDAKSGAGINRFSQLAQVTLKEQIARWREKGQVGRPVRAMVVGIPNVGKSTFINKVAKKKSAKASDRPGVTRGKQWVNVDSTLDLLDTPGILWPKFEDEVTGLHLAFTGAVKDDIMDIETLGCHLMCLMGQLYPSALIGAYKLERLPERQEEENDIAYGYRLLQVAAGRRGMRISGGEFDTERMARVLMDEFRGGKLGRFTLEQP
jgi:ribosome biogenesis GTPase A